jgi:hypothetical protein
VKGVVKGGGEPGDLGGGGVVVGDVASAPAASDSAAWALSRATAGEVRDGATGGDGWR